MNKVLREILIVVVCLSLGYAFSKYTLTSMRGSEYNTNVESNQNENNRSK